jgi:pilus assembly protein CpaF
VDAADRNAEALAADLRRRLVERRRAEAAAGGARGGDLEAVVTALVDQHAAVLSEGLRAQVRELILRDTVGLGPLEELLADPAVTEVMVNGAEAVYVESGGRIEPTEVRFASEVALRDAIERILAPLGRRVDELSPMVDARLADGSRVNVIIPPLSVDGPALSIRRFAAARRAGCVGHADSRGPRPAGRGGWRPPEHPDLGRDGRRKDDAAERALRLYRSR